MISLDKILQLLPGVTKVIGTISTTCYGMSTRLKNRPVGPDTVLESQDTPEPSKERDMLAFIVLAIFTGMCRAMLKADMSLGLYALCTTCLGLVLSAVSITETWQFTGFGTVALIAIMAFTLRKYDKKTTKSVSEPIHEYRDWNGRPERIERAPLGNRRPLF